jgi:transposase
MTAKKKTDPESIVREIKRKTRRKYSAEEKIRIVLEGLRGEQSISELCRREGINPNLYYNWSKEFLEAGKQRLLGNSIRQADSTEVQRLREKNDQLKHLVADLSLDNMLIKKNRGGSGNDDQG